MSIVPLLRSPTCGRPTTLLVWLFSILTGLNSAAAQFVALDPEQTGIRFSHSNGASGDHFVIEPYSAGLAVFDYDGDGLEDVYLLNGSVLRNANAKSVVKESVSASENPSPLRNRLYRNLGDWNFEDVTMQAGVGDMGYGLGVVGGDYDNDGDTDLYVTNYGPNVLFTNQGDGTFLEATFCLNEANDRFSAGAVFLDIEGDGDLDLFCGNYQKFQFDQHIVRTIGSYQFHPGPNDYPPEYDQLFRNDGQGTFEDITQESGIAEEAFTSMGAIAADFDQDGDVDLFVGNDSQPNSFYVNNGFGHFQNDALSSGLAFDGSGASTGNMGVETRDLNGDGRFDVFTTTYQDQMPAMYLNVGQGFFDDATNQLTIDRSLHPHVNWGLGIEDFNNDGLLDIFIANGHFMDNLAKISDKTQVKVRDYVQFQQSNGRFNFSDAASIIAAPVESSRGAAFGDLDLDGDLDGIVLNANARPTVLRNETINRPQSINQHRNAVRDPNATREPEAKVLTPAKEQHNWIQVRLVGTISNRDAAGATVTLQANREGVDTQTAGVHLGRGYQSHYGQTIHFGLGELADSTIRYQLLIQWPSGLKSEFEEIHLNQRHIIIEPSHPEHGFDRDTLEREH